MPTVSFRCSDREKIELEERAGGDMTAFIKARLFSTDDNRDLLQQIIHQLDDRSSSRGGSSSASRLELGMLAEVLLLLRQTVKPDTLRQAQAEIDRLGLEIWSSE